MCHTLKPHVSVKLWRCALPTNISEWHDTHTKRQRENINKLVKHREAKVEHYSLRCFISGTHTINISRIEDWGASERTPVSHVCYLQSAREEELAYVSICILLPLGEMRQGRELGDFNECFWHFTKHMWLLTDNIPCCSCLNPFRNSALLFFGKVTWF